MFNKKELVDSQALQYFTTELKELRAELARAYGLRDHYKERLTKLRADKLEKAILISDLYELLQSQEERRYTLEAMLEKAKLSLFLYRVGLVGLAATFLVLVL